MKRGRPTQRNQREIKKIISQYYEDGISAKIASEDSGINYKTFLKYYNLFDAEIFESGEKNFLVRIKNTKERIIQRLDKDIMSLTKEEKTVESLIESAMQSGNLSGFEKLSKLKLKIIDQRTKTISAKMNLIGTPTADIIIQNGAQA
jgi:hypothetical protein